jgi:excisionase family DNA binding protein
MPARALPLQLPSEQDSAQTREVLSRVTGGQGTPLRLQDLPPGVSQLIQTLLSEVAQGHAVQIIPVHAELRTQEAADLLGVSRPHLVKLLDEGVLPSWKVGAHRRVRLAELLAYRDRREAAARQAMQDLTDLDQELGLL